MTWKKIFELTDNQLLLQLPKGFQAKRVLVVVEDIPDEHTAKLKLMQQAANDPLFLADVQEISDDFQAIDIDHQ